MSLTKFAENEANMYIHSDLMNLMTQDAEIASQTKSGKRKLDPVPSSYHKKYEHLLGKEAAKDAARATDANKSYGFGMTFECVFLIVGLTAVNS